MQALPAIPPPVPAPPARVGGAHAGRASSAALTVALAAVLTIVYWACVRRYLAYDGDIMIRVTRSLAQHGSLRIQDPLFHLNEPYSYYGLAVSLLLLPLFVLGQLVFLDGMVLLTLFEPLVTALTVVTLFRLLVAFGLSWRRSLGISLLYAFGSLAWYYSGVLYSEQLVGLATSAGLLWLLHYTRTGGRRWAFATGGALAIALLARWDALLLVVAPVAIAFAWRWWGRRQPSSRHRVSAALAFAAPIVAVLAVNLAYDFFRFGRPLGGPYTALYQFSTPILTGLYGLLFSPGAGLVTFTPIVALAAAGALPFARRWRAEAFLVLALVAIRLLFYARWGGWDGGANWGPRFLVPIVPLLFIPIAFLPARGWVRMLTMALAGVSVAIEVLGQLVPYGIYYTLVAPALSASAKVSQACGGCPSWQRSEILNQTIDFEPGYAPLYGQLTLLRHGIIDPIWAHIGAAVPLILLVLAVVFLRLRRLADALDRASAPEPWSRLEPTDRSRARGRRATG
jgi:hypothetical protein